MASSRTLGDKIRLWRARAEDAPHAFALSRALYLRLLGLVLVVAFVSFWVQLEGLVGERGILPVSDTFARYERAWGLARLYRAPSLLWLWPTATGAHLLCLLGTVASLLVVVGRVQAVALAVCFVSYLSLFYGAQRWLGFQWDLLLLETTFLSIFLAPWRRRPRQVYDAAAPRFVLWLHWWLVARLMLSSGLGKLLSGDGTWTELTALDYHFWTQPLPNPLAYPAHHLGEGVHAALVVLTLICQVGAPWLLFLGRWPRRVGAALLIASQVGIQATGNFAYFNVLTLALLVLAVDDDALGRLPLVKRLVARWSAPVVDARPAPRAHAPAARALLVVIVFLTAVQSLNTLRAKGAPDVLFEAADLVRPFRLVSGYGLFTRMTTTRPEIEIEGSDDGRTWTPYRFKYKVGPLDRWPPFVAPHQPRLDWQMWFAALGSARRNPWLVRFMRRLQEGEPAVLALLAQDPFAGQPPRYLRAMRYQYRFTSLEERKRTGHLWTRTPDGLYVRPIERPASPPSP
jgi:hypothetical protein